MVSIQVSGTSEYETLYYILHFWRKESKKNKHKKHVHLTQVSTLDRKCLLCNTVLKKKNPAWLNHVGVIGALRRSIIKESDILWPLVGEFENPDLSEVLGAAPWCRALVAHSTSSPPRFLCPRARGLWRRQTERRCKRKCLLHMINHVSIQQMYHDLILPSFCVLHCDAPDHVLDHAFFTSPTPFEYHTKNKRHTCLAPVTHSHSCINANRGGKKNVNMTSSIPPVPFLFQLHTGVVDHSHGLNLCLLLHTSMHMSIPTHTHSHTAMTPRAFCVAAGWEEVVGWDNRKKPLE